VSALLGFDVRYISSSSLTHHENDHALQPVFVLVVYFCIGHLQVSLFLIYIQQTTVVYNSLHNLHLNTSKYKQSLFFAFLMTMFSSLR